MFWDETKKHMSIRMNGKEYLTYLDRKKSTFKLTHKQKIGIAYLSASVIGMIFLAVYFTVPSDPGPSQGLFSGWYEALPVMVSSSWSTIGKFTLLYFAPAIIIFLGLSWVIHGVQLRLLA